MRQNPWMLCCIAAAVLSACTTMDTNHPDQMYRQAIKNNINKDNRYNFTGMGTFKLQDAAPRNSQATATSTASEAADAAALAAKEAAFAADGIKIEVNPKETHHQHQHDNDATMASSHESEALWDGIADEFVGGMQSGGALVNSFMNHSEFKLDGAVDLPQGKVEMVPSFNLATKNYGMWAKIPVQIDKQRESILIDTQGYSGWVQTALLGSDTKPLQSIKKLEEGALLEIKQPEDSKERLPIQTLLRALPKGIDGYLDAMDASKFILAPMDDYGRQLHATYHVTLTYDSLDTIKWSNAMLQAYNQEFVRLQKEEPEAGVSPKAYNDVKSMMLLGAMLFGGDTASCKKDAGIDDEVKEVSDEARIKAESEELDQTLACMGKNTDNSFVKNYEKAIKGMPKITHSLYLSRTGRIVGMQDTSALHSKKHNKDFVMVSQLKMYNYGRPEFSLNPASKPTVSIWDMIKEMKAVEHNDGTQAVDAAADEATAAAIEATAAASH